MKKGFARLTSVLMATLSVSLFSISAYSMILPPNHLDRLDDPSAPSNITEEQFNAIVDHIVDMWQPIAESHHAKLVASKNWDDSTVNAYAQQSGPNWHVSFFGGLARRPELTPDAFALVVCHELGHHFGGYAFYGGYDWASAEGQADYFATQVCARRIWAKSPNNRRHFRDGLSRVQESCEQAWKNKNDIALCDRITDASLSLAKLFASLSRTPEPKVSTKDKSKVSTTYTGHPEAQCRLDTYVSGAVCRAKFDLGVIPGKGHPKGNNSPEAEEEASKYSCTVAGGQELGVRPGCWFKSQLKEISDDGLLATLGVRR
jgi:hypothetical protein